MNIKLQIIIRFFLSLIIASLLMWGLISLWIRLNVDGGNAYNINFINEKKIFLYCFIRSLLLISLALIFSFAFTLFSLFISQKVSRSRITSVINQIFRASVSSIPSIFIAYFLIKFALKFDIFLSYDDKGSLMQNLQRFVLPALILGFSDGLLNDLVNSSEAEINTIKKENYLKMARIIGINLIDYIWRDYAVRFSRIFFMKASALISGAVVIEYIFRIPGLGWLAFESAKNQNIFQLMAVLFCAVIMVFLFNFLYYFFFMRLDPRLR